MMMLIYKNNKVKEIHGIDYPAWKKEGWANNPQTFEPSNPPHPPPNSPQGGIRGGSLPGGGTKGGGLINVNSATQDELTDLPTVGKVMSNKIINARPIESFEDLEAIEGLNVKAIRNLVEF